MEFIVVGFFNEVSSKHIATDIVNIIMLFCNFITGLDVRSFLLYIPYNTDSAHLYNITTNEQYDIKIQHFHKHETNFYRDRAHGVGYTIINNEPLPNPLYNKLKSINKKEENMNKTWSMFVSVGGMDRSEYGEMILGDYCYLSAYNSVRMSKTAYSLELPCFPKCIENTSIVYNKYNKTLYAINGSYQWCSWDDKDDKIGQEIYSLDFNYNDMESYWSWDYWNPLNTNKSNWKWKLLSNNLLWRRYHTCSCIVDNQYIAILGGTIHKKYDDPYVYGELFAINCNKSIPMKKIKREKVELDFGECIYHEKFHKIILYETRRCSIYDINKDEWYNFDKLKSLRNICPLTHNVWISSYNPNIIFFSGESDDKNVFIESYDIRTGKHIGCVDLYAFYKDIKTVSSTRIISHITL